MSRTRALASIAGAMAAVAGITIVGASGQAGASPSPVRMLLAGSAVPFASSTAATGDVAGTQQLSIQVWLRPDVAAAQRFATAVSTPGSPQFRRYLSPDAYTARFGATRGEAAKVESWLRSEGFAGVRADSQRSYVRATAAASRINAAFGVQLKVYKSSAGLNAGRYQLRANNRAVSVPASLSGSVLGVTGLDNAAPLLPLDRPAARPGGRPALADAPGTGAGAVAAPALACSSYYGQHMATGLPEQFGTTSFPTYVCGYSARQLRAAYGANSRNTGKGQRIALVELGLTPDMFLTLQDYAAAGHVQAPSAQRYAELSLGAGSQCGDPANIEEQLDVEASYDMAPAASQLVVGGDSCNNGDFGLQGLFDADIAILGGSGSNHPLASVASNSWEGGTEAQPAFVTSIEHAYLLRSAAEGVGMYFSAGDSSGVESPSDDPFAVSVGGTTLGIGKTGNRLFETGWSTGQSFVSGGAWVLQDEQGASGGGPSVLFGQPGYQQGVVPAALAAAPGISGKVRSAPDISADADSFTGMATGVLTFDPGNPGAPPTFGDLDIGGTSLSSPLVAGIVTAAQQGQHVPFGLINPAIYQLAGTSAFHDILPLTSSSLASFRGAVCGAAACGSELLATFDDQDPGMSGYTGQVTLKGYDNMTGLGSPAGQAFITALRRLEQ